MDQTIQIHSNVSESFKLWLSQCGGSLILSTYQAGKVATISWAGQPTILMRKFDKPLGLAVSKDQIALATRNDIIFFANAPLLAHDYLEDQPGRYDALYLPRASFHTGDLHIHDLAFTSEGIVFVNTRFSCLAQLSYTFNFQPIWRPKFISDFVPEDRCHLNGLALRDGRPRYVTALGTVDTVGGWRPTKADGGVVIDIETNDIIAEGLSMPHSPRWYDNRLWFLNSGAGELMMIEPNTGRKVVVHRLPGYLRGLSFIGPYAVIGMCKIREKHIFGGLPVQDRNEKLHCGLAIIDLRSGLEQGRLEFTEGCEELYDIQFLPGVFRPTILNLERPETRQAVINPDSSYWLRPSNEIKDDAEKSVQTFAAPALESAVGAEIPS